MIVIYEIKTFVAQFAMLFSSTFVSKKAFPIFSFVIGINLGVIMTYLYVSSRFADSILGLSHNNQNINFEQLQDLEKSEDLIQHQSKLLHNGKFEVFEVLRKHIFRLLGPPPHPS